MIITLTLAATLSYAQCHPKPHHARHMRPTPEATCAPPVLPYATWQPRDNEDSLSPLTIGPLTRYLIITRTEPCYVYSSIGGIMGDYSSGGGISVHGLPSMRTAAPEIDPAGWPAGLTMLAAGVAVIRGGRNSK